MAPTGSGASVAQRIGARLGASAVLAHGAHVVDGAERGGGGGPRWRWRASWQAPEREAWQTISQLAPVDQAVRHASLAWRSRGNLPARWCRLHPGRRRSQRKASCGCSPRCCCAGSGCRDSMPQIGPRQRPCLDAYVRHRAWTPHVISGVGRSSDIVRAWRLLLAEADASGRWTAVSIPWSDVRAIAAARDRCDPYRRPARRVPGYRPCSTRSWCGSSWCRRALLGVEIDYDCSTSSSRLAPVSSPPCGRARYQL